MPTTFKKKDLLAENYLLNQRIKELEQSEAECKQMEKVLREKEEKYRAFFDTSRDCVFITSVDGYWIDLNDAALQLFGYESREELLNVQVKDLYANPDQRQQHLQIINQQGYLQEKPLALRKKDGTIIDTLITSVARKGDTGKIIGYQGTIRDITERKQREKLLHISEERFRSLVETTSDWLWETDAQGVYTYASPKVKDILGYEPSDVLGKTPSDLMSSAEAERVAKIMFQYFKGKKAFATFENLNIHKDGRIVVLETSGVPITDENGHLTGYRGIDRDITKRKLVEEEKRRLEERLQQAEKMEALGTLAGGVAHDLNNVLGIIVGYAELLLMNADKSSLIKPQLMNIVKGGQRAAAIVDDLLTLARRGVSSRQVLNLNKIVADMQQSPGFEELYSCRPFVTIKTDLEPDLLNISGSSVHLSKTLFNLVLNACEAMPDSGILTIKTANQYMDKPIQGYDEVREGDYVVLSVSDTGEGIPAADLKRIFEPFYTRKIMGRSGTGLGLAVVWGTVKDHLGYINVQSEEGKGSTFTLYFPVVREEMTSEAVAMAVSEYIGSGETILVVDDVKEQRELATEILRKLNYNVASVSSGEEAVTYIKKNNVDLMVLDMIMDPGMDGLDTYKSVVEIRPTQKAIIVSGFSESDRVHDAQALGAGAYVKKPYTIEKLGLAARNELNKK